MVFGRFEGRFSPRGSSNYESSKLWLSLGVLCVTAALFAAKMPGAPLMGAWLYAHEKGVHLKVLTGI